MLLIGTHKDELVGAGKLEQAQEMLSNHIRSLYIAKKTQIIEQIQKASEQEWFYAVDNKSRNILKGKIQCSDPTIGKIRSALENIVRKDDRKVQGTGRNFMCETFSLHWFVRIHAGLNGKCIPYLEFDMPLRFLMLLDELKSGSGGSSRSVCLFDDVVNTAAKLEVGCSPQVIRYLLRIFSRLGIVSWFPELNEDLVVLNPQWLINSMASLIREHHGEHAQLLNELKKDDEAIRLYKEADIRNGIFPVVLLNYIWSSDKKQYKCLKGKPNEITALKGILEKFGLICRGDIWREDSHSVERCYVVPALLPHPRKNSCLDARIRGLLECSPDAEACTCCFDFAESRWLPQFLFERLVCTIVASHGVVHVRDILIARGVADIRAGDAVLLLRLNDKKWRITAQTVNHKDCPHAARWMLQLVDSGMTQMLKGFRKHVAHRVLISTKDGDVDVSQLRRHNTVVTTENKTIMAKPLRTKWLGDTSECDSHCYDKQRSVIDQIIDATTELHMNPAAATLKQPIPNPAPRPWPSFSVARLRQYGTLSPQATAWHH